VTARDPRAKTKILAVVGARPNFMKIAPILRAAKRSRALAATLVHTGQHYDESLSGAFFRELRIDPPAENLGVGSGSHAQQTAEVMRRIEPVIADRRPDLVLVVGDVNSTLAAALTAVKLGVRVAHVEAGLRSFDRRMPEEINRILVDSISDFAFVSEPSGVANLRREGVPRERVHLVGNVMIDTLLALRKQAAERSARERYGLERRAFVLATLHRPENVDTRGALRVVVEALAAVARLAPVVFPVHPRTRRRIESLGLARAVRAARGLRLEEPLGYLDFVSLLDDAALVVTDSGGVQEEAAILGTPCLTRRDSTERPLTLRGGANRLVAADVRAIVREARAVLSGERRPRPLRHPLWDGAAAERIVAVLEADARSLRRKGASH
jgi:UDP-N-acetylglucosamine 2-epimerase (non-hydrolysing)